MNIHGEKFISNFEKSVRMYCSNKTTLQDEAVTLTTLMRFLIALFFGLFGFSSVQAHSVYSAVDSYDYEVVLGDVSLDLAPVGLAIGGSVDLNEKIYLQYELGQWQDNDAQLDATSSSSNFESTLMNLSVGLKLANWELSAFYTDIGDEVVVLSDQILSLNMSSELELRSYKLLAKQTKQIGNWERYYAVGLQYDQSESRTVFSDVRQMEMQNSDAVYGMFKFGGDYYLKTNENSGWLVGGSVSWYQSFSSNDDIRQFDINDNGDLLRPTGRGGNGGGPGNGVRINRTFGDDFGIAALYATYQISENWSLDWNSSLGFAGDVNSNSHALTLGFMF